MQTTKSWTQRHWAWSIGVDKSKEYREGAKFCNSEFTRIWLLLTKRGYAMDEKQVLQVKDCGYEKNSKEYEEWHKGFKTQWEKRNQVRLAKLPFPYFW